MLLKNISYSIGSNLLSSFIALIQSILVARYLGASILGIIVASQAIVLILRSIIGFRLDEAAVFFINRLDFNIAIQKDRAIKIISTIFTLEIVTITITSILSIIFFFGIVKFSPQDNYNFYALILVIFVLFTTSLDVIFVTLSQYQNKYKFLSKVVVIINFLSILLIIFLITIEKLNIYSYLLSLAFLGAVKFFFYLTVVQKFLHNKLKFNLFLIYGLLNNSNLEEDRQHNRFFSFIRAGYVSSTLSQLCKWSPVFFLALISSTETVGNFRVALNLASIGSYLITPFNNVLFQWLNKYKNKLNMLDFCYLYRNKLIVWIIFSLISAITIWYLANDIILTLYGTTYNQSVSMFKILFIGISISNAFFWVRSVALVQGLESSVYSATTFISMLQLIIMYPLSLFYGTNGIIFLLSLAWALGPLLFFYVAIKYAQ